MGSETTPSVQSGFTETVKKSARREPYRAHQVFQIGLLWLVLTSLWLMLGPEPATTIDFCIEAVAVGMGAFVSLSAWLASSRFSFLFKLLATVVSLMVTLPIISVAVIDFELTNRVLEPAVVRGDRVIHRSLGLSYARMPHCKVNLEPAMTNQISTAGSLMNRSGSGLHYGETAIISRMSYLPESHESTRPRWTIVLEIQRDRITDLNSFILNVRRSESNWARFPNIQIRRPTHLTYRRGVNLAEFDFVEGNQGLVSRQVYIRRGPFILNFMLNSEVESDNQVFEEFLNSLEFRSFFHRMDEVVTRTK